MWFLFFLLYLLYRIRWNRVGLIRMLKKQRNNLGYTKIGGFKKKRGVGGEKTENVALHIFAASRAEIAKKAKIGGRFFWIWCWRVKKNQSPAGMSIPRTGSSLPDKHTTTNVIREAKIQNGTVVKTTNFFYFFVRPRQKIGILSYKLWKKVEFSRNCAKSSKKKLRVLPQMLEPMPMDIFSGWYCSVRALLWVAVNRNIATKSY